MLRYIFLGFALVLINLEDYFSFPVDARDVFIIFFLLTNFFLFLNTRKKIPKSAYSLFGFLFILWLYNLVVGYFSYGQSLFNSLLGSRIYFLYMLLFYFLLKLNIDIRTLFTRYFLSFFLSIFLLLNIYTYLTNDFSILSPNLVLTVRDNEVRFFLNGATILSLMIYFISFKKKLKAEILLLVISILVVIFISKTRAFIAGFSVFMFFNIYSDFVKTKKHKRLYNLILLLFSIVSIGFIINFLIDFSNADPNTAIRVEAFDFFVNIIVQHPYSVIIGLGVPLKDNYNSLADIFFLSDLGIFQFFFYHGLFGIIFLVTISRKFLKIERIFNSRMSDSKRSGFRPFSNLIFFSSIIAPTIFMFLNVQGAFFYLFFIAFYCNQEKAIVHLKSALVKA